MHRILLLLDHRENRNLLASWLSNRYNILLPEHCPPPDDPFDFCILDGTALNRLWNWAQSCKAKAEPVFLPFLLVTSRSSASMATRAIWQSIDEMLLSPVEKVELQLRVEVLLRTRQLSLELQQRNTELKAARERLEQEIKVSEQARLELQQSEQRFRTLLETAPDAIVIVNQQGQIILVNSRTERLFGYSRDELYGRTLDLLLPDGFRSEQVYDCDRYQTHYPQASSMDIRLEGWARRQDGSEFPVDVSLSPIETPVDQLTTAVIRDITIRKQAELDIQNALQTERELNAMKSRFVSMVSHEFRNPLASISLATHLLEQGNDTWSDEKKQQYFQRIKQIIRNMTELLEDVLFIGKADLGKSVFNPAPIDLAQFCQELVDELQLHVGSHHDIQFTTTSSNCQTETLAIHADAKLLRHILTNLLTNAAKYSPQNRNIYLTLCQEKDTAIFQIRDEGIGIPIEDQARLFESFHRASNVGRIPGTGLGLSIVKRCIDIHGGTIAVESTANIGTTFTVTIPLQNANLP